MKNVAAFRFQPFSRKQKKLLTWWTRPSPYRDHDMVVCDGSIRAGKTVAMIDSFTTWSLATFQDESFILAGKSMGALKRNVLKPLFSILAAKGIPHHYNRSEHFIEIGSNTYYCFGANNEASQDVMQGLTAAGALGDEAALFPQSFVEQMIARCSVEGSKVWLNCNPEGPHHWIKTDLIDQAHEKRILHLHFTLDDNPALSPKVKERYKRLFSGLWYKRMILGLWVLAEGTIYDLFDESTMVIPQPPGPAAYYLVGVDYGTGNPTVFGLFGVAANRTARPRVWLEREWYHDSRKAGRQMTDSEYAEAMRQWLGSITPRTVFVDPSAASFKLELRRAGLPVRDADNSVIDGIRTQARMLQTGEYKICACCQHTIEEYGAYVWDPKAQARGEDKPLKENDHCADMQRYCLHTAFGRDLELSTGYIDLGPAWR